MSRDDNMMSDKIYMASFKRGAIPLSAWLTLNQAVSQAPNKRGIYVMRSNRAFGRVRGKSDVVYIGSSTNLKHRLKQYVKPFKKVSSPTQRVKWFSEKYPIEVAFAITSETKKMP